MINSTRTITYGSKLRVCYAFIELILYIIFVFATTVLALSTHHVYMLYFNQMINVLFLNRDIKTNINDYQMNFNKLVTPADWFNFLEYNFLEGFHGEDDELNITHTLLKENQIIGPARLRQMRVRKNTCHVPDVFATYSTDCYAEYTAANEDRSVVFMSSSYSNRYDLHATSIRGKLAKYTGGGYIVELTHSKEANRLILNDLRHKRWIDRATRLVLIEFVLFNTNTNLFNNVKFIAEFTPIGSIIPIAQIQALNVDILYENRLFIAAIVFYVLIVYYIVEANVKLSKFGCKRYFSSKWNYLELIIIILAILSLIYNVWHPIYMTALLQQINANGQSYHSLDIICFYNSIYRNVMAATVFLVWIKIFKFMDFNKSMVIFGMTLRKCSMDLFWCLLTLLIIIIAYAQFGIFLYGTTHRDFCNFSESFLTVMGMPFGGLQYKTLVETHPIWTPIYFLSFFIFIYFILLSLFLVVIINAYHSVRHGNIEEPNFLYYGLSKLCACKYCRTKKKKIQNKVGHSMSEKKDTDKNRNKTKPVKRLMNNRSNHKINKAPIRIRGGSKPLIFNSIIKPKRSFVRKSEIMKYFEVCKPLHTHNREDIKRLATRVSLLEDILEQLIGNMDQILNKFEVNQE